MSQNTYWWIPTQQCYIPSIKHPTYTAYTPKATILYHIIYTQLTLTLLLFIFFLNLSS